MGVKLLRIAGIDDSIAESPVCFCFFLTFIRGVLIQVEDDETTICRNTRAQIGETANTQQMCKPVHDVSLDKEKQAATLAAKDGLDDYQGGQKR